MEIALLVVFIMLIPATIVQEIGDWKERKAEREKEDVHEQEIESGGITMADMRLEYIPDSLGYARLICGDACDTLPLDVAIDRLAREGMGSTSKAEYMIPESLIMDAQADSKAIVIHKGKLDYHPIKKQRKGFLGRLIG